MNGLLLKLHGDEAEHPEFWELFSSIRKDFDRFYWCFSHQPWMGPPAEFLEEDILEPFQERCNSGTQLWRPGAISRYADAFAEEQIELWVIDPDRDDPQRLATLYSDAGWSKSEEVIQSHARVWLLYTDSTCWEIYSRESSLFERVNEDLRDKPWVDVYKSESDHREGAFGIAGLSEVWEGMNG